jgi:hypothetical protein
MCRPDSEEYPEILAAASAAVVADDQFAAKLSSSYQLAVAVAEGIGTSSKPPAVAVRRALAAVTLDDLLGPPPDADGLAPVPPRTAAESLEEGARPLRRAAARVASSESARSRRASMLLAPGEFEPDDDPAWAHTITAECAGRAPFALPLVDVGLNASLMRASFAQYEPALRALIAKARDSDDKADPGLAKEGQRFESDVAKLRARLEGLDAELADAGEDGPYAQYAVASEAWKALRELWGGAHALLVRYTRTDAGRIEALKRGELAVPAWNASLEFLRDEWEVGDDPTVEDLEFAES